MSFLDKILGSWGNLHSNSNSNGGRSDTEAFSQAFDDNRLEIEEFSNEQQTCQLSAGRVTLAPKLTNQLVHLNKDRRGTVGARWCWDSCFKVEFSPFESLRAV